MTSTTVTWDQWEDHATRYFWPRVDNTGGALACWPWTGSRDRDGYGRISLYGWGMKAHRYSYMIANGRVIDNGQHIAHTCDNPPCVNPYHLRQWTPGLNRLDSDLKGRQRPRRGELAGGAKLSDAAVAAIRRYADEAGYQPRRGLAGNGVVPRILAARYGVSTSQIARILSHRSRSATLSARRFNP